MAGALLLGLHLVLLVRFGNLIALLASLSANFNNFCFYV